MVLDPYQRYERSAIIVGAGIRILMLLLAVPITYSNWFLPFLDFVLRHGGIDPWTGFINSGGTPVAFPYGPLYLMGYLPLVGLGSLISHRFMALGLSLSVLLFDVGLWRVLLRLAGPGRSVIVTYGYWLSPIVIYVCYWHGQLDVLPVLILMLSLLLLREAKYTHSGATLGLAAAAKLSMLLAIPFVWIYVTVPRRLRGAAPRLIVATIAAFVTLVPFGFSSGFRQMVLDTPEKEKLYVLAIPYGDLQFYLMPLAYIGLVFAAWRIRRFNFDILSNFVGIAFFALLLLTPASPGWAMWLIPFIVMHLRRGGLTGWSLTIIFSFLFVAFHLATSSGAVFSGQYLIDFPAHERVTNLLLSVYLAAAGGLVYQMTAKGVLEDPFYRNSRAPFMIAIAGDSGAGKDTLADSLAGLFGKAGTAVLSGDDYHSWDRHKPMWRALTHLNPRANNLRRFSEDALLARRGYELLVPHYDHKVGRMTKPRVVPSADVVIVLGLHALYLPELQRAADLRIYLAMDEELRRFFKLRRDVHERGHSPAAVYAALAKREADSARYIRPQMEIADIILSLVPADPRQVQAPLTRQSSPAMALIVEASPTNDLSALSMVLISLCGLEITEQRSGKRAGIRIFGDPTCADIAAAAKVIAPDLFDHLSLKPCWAPGLTGIMQLAILDQISQRQTKGSS